MEQQSTRVSMAGAAAEQEERGHAYARSGEETQEQTQDGHEGGSAHDRTAPRTPEGRSERYMQGEAEGESVERVYAQIVSKRWIWKCNMIWRHARRKERRMRHAAARKMATAATHVDRAPTQQQHHRWTARETLFLGKQGVWRQGIKEERGGGKGKREGTT